MEVNITEAEAHLSKLWRRVAEGEEVVIAKAGKPLARLVAVTPLKFRRKIGSAAGDFTVPAALDEPLPESVLGEFE